MNKKILIIVGQTASGKSALAVQLAKKYNGEIVSADSRQVYRGLDIGTGKITCEEMEGIPHHLLDVADPATIYTASDYARDATEAIDEILSRGKLPIVTGGTFFYIDTLLGKVHTPAVLPNHTLREALSKHTTEELSNQLKARDIDRWSAIDTKNRVRLVRAIEVASALGKVPPSPTVAQNFHACTLGIRIDKELLHERIRQRLMDRLDHGMVAEAKLLHQNGLSFERMETLGLEYRYLADYLRGTLTYEQMAEEIETKSRHYAKRQMTWLKRDPEIIWVDPRNMREIENAIDTKLFSNRTFQ